jgi:hypothetical protein
MAAQPEFPDGPLPPINSNCHHLLLDDHPHHNTLVAVAYGDSDWATCVKTHCSFSGICIQLAGGTIAYKTKFQPTVALSTTKAEFMAACDVGRMSLFMRSILWDLDIPQEAGTVAYEDNNGCTAMGNAQKPTAQTRHINFVNGLSAISFDLNASTHPLTLLTISQSLSVRFYFISMPTSYLDTSRQSIIPYMPMPLRRTAIRSRMLIGSCLCLLQPP